MRIIELISILLCLTGCLQQPPLKTGLEGKKIPSFTFQLIDSTTLLNTDGIKEGRPFIVFYFDPSCPHCRAELRDIINHNKDFKNVSFYMFTTFPYKAVKHFSDEFNLEAYPNFTIGIDYTDYLYKYFSIPKVPFLAFYDKKKCLNQVLVGKTDYKTIQTQYQSIE